MRASDGTVFDLHGPENAPLVVLIHGVGLNRHCWQWTIPALADRYRVASYDFYGHGESPDPPETPTLGLLSRQLQGVLDACGVQSAAIVGFSLDGMIARRFAQDHPDFRAFVEPGAREMGVGGEDERDEEADQPAGPGGQYWVEHQAKHDAEHPKARKSAGPCN